MPKPSVNGLVIDFLKHYDAKAKDANWLRQSEVFKIFWSERVLAKGTNPLPDEDCDVIIRILDRNGKGNTKDTEAVARAMVPQGAWRRMFNEFAREADGRIFDRASSFLQFAGQGVDPARNVSAVYEFTQRRQRFAPARALRRSEGIGGRWRHR